MNKRNLNLVIAVIQINIFYIVDHLLETMIFFNNLIFYFY